MQGEASGCGGKRGEESASDGRTVNVSGRKSVPVRVNDRPGPHMHTRQRKEMQANAGECRGAKAP